MRFGNKNKIKKRVSKDIDGRAVGHAYRQAGLARRGKTEKRRHSIWRKILNILLLLVFVGSTVYLLFFSPFLQVTKIDINGVQDLDAGAIRNVASSTIDGKYLNMVDKNNVILISSEQLRGSIMEKFKRIEDVQVEKKFPDTLEVRVVERKSMVILCSAGACFIVDKKGVPYAAADFESNELRENNLTVIADDGNRTIKLGEPTLSQDFMQYLLDIKDELKSDLGIDIDKNFRTPQLVSGDIRVMTSEGWQIYFDNSLPVQKEIDSLKLILSEKVGEDNRKNLEYVDLRTENKVYYKLKNTEPVQPPVEEVKKEESKKDKEK